MVFLLEHWHFCQTGAFWSFLFNSIHTWRICLFSCILHTSGLWRRGIHCRCSSLQSLRGQFFFIHCTPFFPSLLEKNDQCDNFYRQIEQTPQTHTHTHTLDGLHYKAIILLQYFLTRFLLVLEYRDSLLIIVGWTKERHWKQEKAAPISLTHTHFSKQTQTPIWIYL